MFKIGIIGRGEELYNSVINLIDRGFDVAFIVTAKEAPEYKYNSEDFKVLAREHSIPFLHNPKVDRDKLQDLIGQTSVDICVSINYSGIISSEVIELFPLGILNLHGGDLPRYRGNACQAWAILNGEERIGLCVHKMIGGELDSGMIIQREYLDINIDTRIGQVYKWMSDVAPKLILRAIEKLSDNPEYFLEKQSSNPSDILRTYPRKPEDGRINWTDSNTHIVRLVNASSEPFSGAFAFLNGEKIIIWRARVHNDSEEFCAIPGQVTSVTNQSKGSIVVAVGKGKIQVDEVEFKGVRCTPAEVIKSLRTRFT